MKTRYEQFLESYPESAEFAYRFLVELRRQIAGDGPQDRHPGTLEDFDKACNELGVPFLKP